MSITTIAITHQQYLSTIFPSIDISQQNRLRHRNYEIATAI